MLVGLSLKVTEVNVTLNYRIACTVQRAPLYRAILEDPLAHDYYLISAVCFTYAPLASRRSVISRIFKLPSAIVHFPLAIGLTINIQRGRD